MNDNSNVLAKRNCALEYSSVKYINYANGESFL